MFNTWALILPGPRGGGRPGDGRKKEARYLRDRVRSRAERPPGGTALNQGSVVGSGFSGAFKCFRSCLECRKRLSETKAETAFLIGSRGVGLLPILHLSLAPRLAALSLLAPCASASSFAGFRCSYTLSFSLAPSFSHTPRDVARRFLTRSEHKEESISRSFTIAARFCATVSSYISLPTFTIFRLPATSLVKSLLPRYYTN